MLLPFFALAGRSPTRQRSLRRAATAHVLVLAGTIAAMNVMSAANARQLLGSVVLVDGIVFGALLIGWRLTQLPKSQALEFLFVSPLRPSGIVFAEGLVGIVLLGLVTLAGVPLLAVLAGVGYLHPLDLVPLVVMPFTWGAITGFGLTVWAYEPAGIRRRGERIAMGLVVLYLTLGVLAGENLRYWVQVLPTDLSVALLRGFARLHTHNPFGVMKHWFESDIRVAWERAAGLQLAAVIALFILMWRACSRLQGHFHELHYDPREGIFRTRPAIDGEPLTWWAVQRVSRYSGRINLWLAGGFGVLYALYTVAGPHWPAWLGQRVFQIADGAGGIPGLATGLVLLSAVPAAFQYGLWDSSVPERCRRLELLLLTELSPRDYWRAAAAAAWQRGRGYFAVALLLWTSALLAGRLGPAELLLAISGGVLLWGLYFTLGFGAFARGLQANSLGMLLTVGLPLVAYGLHQLGLPSLGALSPPGLVHAAAAGSVPLAGAVVCGVSALLLARHALASCDANLRAWYDRNVGRKVVG